VEAFISEAFRGRIPFSSVLAESSQDLVSNTANPALIEISSSLAITQRKVPRSIHDIVSIAWMRMVGNIMVRIFACDVERDFDSDDDRF